MSDFDNTIDETIVDDFDDEIGAEGNRIEGARAAAVVEHCARAVADEPDGIDVVATEHRNEVTLSVHTAPGDMGRIIGRRGRVIQAIRTVARAAASADGVRVSVEVVE